MTPLWADIADPETSTTEATDATPESDDTLDADVAIAEAAITAHKTRENSKQTQVIAMLRLPGGATTIQIAEATGWLNHTIRGFMAIAKKKLSLTIVSQRVVVGTTHTTNYSIPE